MKPNSTDAHSLVQRIYWRKNDIPAYRDAVVRLCQLHLRAQDFDAALEDYDEYKELRRRDHSGIHMARAVPRRRGQGTIRSEEHTSELQSRLHLVCRLLLEKNTILP